MEHFFELVAELLFGFAKHTPDKMPDDITYKPDFIVKGSTKKNLARIFASIVIIAVFSTLWIIVKHEARYLFAVFVVFGLILIVLSFVSFSFSCHVTESTLESSFWGLFKKKLQWNNVQCIRVIEKTEEKSVTIAIYDQSGKCIIDLDTELDNALYVVKMAEEKNIAIHNEKDLS